MSRTTSKTSAREKILHSALRVIRAKGYSATTVDDLCAEAGVTKGAFFHHFKSKEDLAVSAAAHWTQVTNALFESADYQKIEDPRARLLGYVELRKRLLEGSVPEVTCLVGTMVQETYDSNPAIREACARSIFGHADDIEKMVRAAKARYAPAARWDPRGVAEHVVAVQQGAFIVSKAKDDLSLAAACLDHLRDYLELLLTPKEK